MAPSEFRPDPFAAGLVAFGKELRRGSLTSETAVAACLDRIDKLDGRLGAFEHVARESALAVARSLDRLLASGTDLGSLMGVPVAIKDLIAVEGMPTSAGSNLDVSDLIGREGTFVRTLRRAGCVIVGKTKTPEFAYGRGGVNSIRGTPWNPWSPSQHRTPGGSSSGSAVSVAAGLCGFAIGTDTIGSIRLPAALCGVFGLKPTVGIWPTDGVFPLSRTLDTIGLLTRTAEDAAVVFSVLAGRSPPRPAPARGLRLGRPRGRFYEELDHAIAARLDAVLDSLAAAGVDIASVNVADGRELEEVASGFTAPELIASLGRDRFLDHRNEMDALTAPRAAPGLEVAADAHVSKLARHRKLCTAAAGRMAGFDALVAPSVPIAAPLVADLIDDAKGPRLAVELARNMSLGNLLGLCAASAPVGDRGSPVGLEILCPAGQEDRLLSIALLVEQLVGKPTMPPIEIFLES